MSIFCTFRPTLESQQVYCKLTKNLEGGLSMGIYSIRVQYDRSLLVGKCVNGLEQRTTVAPANFIGYRISSFKFPLGLIVSVSFSAQYCQSHLWYRTGWDNECKAPPPLFQYAPSLFGGEKLLSPLQSFKLPLPSSSAFF